MGGSKLAKFLSDLTRQAIPGKKNPPVILSNADETMVSILGRLQTYEDDPQVLVVFEHNSQVCALYLSVITDADDLSKQHVPQTFGHTASVSMLYDVASQTGETFFKCGVWSPTSRASVTDNDLVLA